MSGQYFGTISGDQRQQVLGTSGAVLSTVSSSQSGDAGTTAAPRVHLHVRLTIAYHNGRDSHKSPSARWVQVQTALRGRGCLQNSSGRSGGLSSNEFRLFVVAPEYTGTKSFGARGWRGGYRRWFDVLGLAFSCHVRTLIFLSTPCSRAYYLCRGVGACWLSSVYDRCAML